MVEVLTYKATKVYTPQTSEWAERAKDVEAIGKTVSGGLKDLAKMEEKKEIKAEAEAKAVAKEKKAAYDKMLDAQADNFAQNYQIELVRQTQLINAQYKDDPTNPEKENQIRAVAKDLQAQMAEKLPQENRQRFFQKAETKTNDYILSDLKAELKNQFDDFKNQSENNVRQTLENIKVNSVWGDFGGAHKRYLEGRENLENYVSGIMTPDETALALRQYDKQTISALIDGVARNNPDFARELKDNPAAIAAILGGGDYLTELATRSELNKGTEQIDGMTFDKNGRYQKEKERAKLVNSLGVVEIDYDNDGQPAKTTASSSANPKLTKYVAELMGGGVGRDIDLSIKQAENAQKAKLEKAKYDGAVQAVLDASYQNLDKIKNSNLYKNGDEYTVKLADEYGKMLDGRNAIIGSGKEVSLAELNEAYNDLGKLLEQIDGRDYQPVLDSYITLAKVENGLNEYAPAEDTYSKMEKVYQRAVTDPEFRDNLTKTIAAANILDHYAELFSSDMAETDKELKKGWGTTPIASGVMRDWKTGKAVDFNYDVASEKNKAKYRLVRDTYINAMADVANEDFESANKKIFALPYNVAFINYDGKIKQEDIARFMQKDAKGDNTPVEFQYNGYTFQYLGVDKTGTILAKRRL